MKTNQPISFSKYHGAGNDFIIIDNRDGNITLTDDQRRLMYDRRFGIGADGVLELRSSDAAEFTIVYQHADGTHSALCGNGCRCVLDFVLRLSDERVKLVKLGDEWIHGANQLPNDVNHDDMALSYKDESCSRSELELLSCAANSDTKVEEAMPQVLKEIKFEAIDGIHTGGVSDEKENYFVDLSDVAIESVIAYDNGDFWIYNGSLHHVRFMDSVSEVDFENEARKIRYNTLMYGDKGTNVNFVEEKFDEESGCYILKGRIYERGVEMETPACGTGAVAIAIADYLRKSGGDYKVDERIWQDEDITMETEVPQNGVGDDLKNRFSWKSSSPKKQGDNDSSDMKNGDSTPNTLVTKWVKQPGGMLRVEFVVTKSSFTKIRLHGPVAHVYDGLFWL